MLRKKKTYSRPKRPFDKVRIDEEAKIKEEFGLKNKREIWKAEAKIKSMREKAKKLISAGPDEQQTLFDKLGKIGIKVNSITDILGLDKRDYLEQRLQTIVVKKMLARSMKSARQLITHKKVLVDGKMISSPSYIVPLALRNKISLKVTKKKPTNKKIEEKSVEALKSVPVHSVPGTRTSNEVPSSTKNKDTLKGTSKKTEESLSEEGKKVETAPAEEQVEEKQADEKTQKEVMEDAQENA